MQSVFMSKSAALWLMRSLEHTVIRVNPKQFFTFKEGDTAYTLQRGSNLFGQYLSVTELNVGGLRRNIIISAGKFQQGWKTFGIELRRRLEPSQYALGGLNFVPFKPKQIPKYLATKSFVEAVKAPVQARSKLAQQPFIKEKAKDGVVGKRMEFPKNNSHTQVAENFLPSVVGDGKGGESGINQPYRFSAHDKRKWLLGDTKGEKQNLLSEKAVSLPGSATLEGTEVGSQCSTEDFNFGKIYSVGNKRRSPLHFKSNWTEHVYGKKGELRKSD